eukprot:m.52693 g.52693  ORF g.52693 m.52693 type:complete len:62 (+) comp11325_c1_seq1:1635-1820(+)
MGLANHAQQYLMIRVMPSGVLQETRFIAITELCHINKTNTSDTSCSFCTYKHDSQLRVAVL